MDRPLTIRLALAIGIGLTVGAFTSCQSVAPGEDSVVVNAEKVLKVAPQAYDLVITFAEQNKAKLSLSTLKTFEGVRVEFPPAYRAFDSGVQTYRLAKAKDAAKLGELQGEVKRVLKNGCTLVVQNGGPDLCGGLP